MEKDGVVIYQNTTVQQMIRVDDAFEEGKEQV